MRSALFGLILILGGCASTVSPPPRIMNTCPELKSYTANEEETIAQILESTPENSTIRSFIHDYGNLRKQIRACQSIK